MAHLILTIMNVIPHIYTPDSGLECGSELHSESLDRLPHSLKDNKRKTLKLFSFLYSRAWYISLRAWFIDYMSRFSHCMPALLLLLHRFSVLKIQLLPSHTGCICLLMKHLALEFLLWQSRKNPSTNRRPRVVWTTTLCTATHSFERATELRLTHFL